MLELNVCIGSSCHLKGSYNVIQTFRQIIEEEALHEKLSMQAQFCMKHCQYGVSVMLDGEVYSVSPDTARSFFASYVKPKLEAQAGA